MKIGKLLRTQSNLGRAVNRQPCLPSGMTRRALSNDDSRQHPRLRNLLPPCAIACLIFINISLSLSPSRVSRRVCARVCVCSLSLSRCLSLLLARSLRICKPLSRCPRSRSVDPSHSAAQKYSTTEPKCRENLTKMPKNLSPYRLL